MRPSKVGFISVGIFAAAIHYCTAIVANKFGHTPASANWIGFMFAFPVSYVGHRKWSFRGTTATHMHAFAKSLLIALSAMLVNQWLLSLLLTNTKLPFWLALGFVDSVVSIGSWILNRFWAFHHK